MGYSSDPPLQAGYLGLGIVISLVGLGWMRRVGWPAVGRRGVNRLGVWSASALSLSAWRMLSRSQSGLRLRGSPSQSSIPSWRDGDLTLLSAPILVVLMAAVHGMRHLIKKIHGVVAVAFMVLLAGLTSSVHFVEPTAVRQSSTASLIWPSTAYALELLAWDLFLGLSLLFAAPVFKGGKLEDAVRTGLYVGGTLCIAGILGPASGDMRLQFIAIVGYAGVLPTVSLLLLLLFRRTQT